jgi:very-short-patch-repair endonuclease
VSDPTTVFLELATLVGSDALVAVGDHLALEPRVLDPTDARPYVAADALRAAARRTSIPGSRAARTAAAMVRTASESPMETRLRLLVLAAGLPEPVLQYELHDAVGRVGWFDLAWPAERLIAEYDGDQHRTSRDQYERDIRRFNRATDAGWRVLRVRAQGLLREPEGTRDRLLRAWHTSP